MRFQNVTVSFPTRCSVLPQQNDTEWKRNALPAANPLIRPLATFSPCQGEKGHFVFLSPLPPQKFCQLLRFSTGERVRVRGIFFLLVQSTHRAKPPQPACGHLLPLARGRRDILFSCPLSPRRNFANFYSFPRGERARVRGTFYLLVQSTHRAKPPHPACGHLLPLARGRRDISFPVPSPPQKLFQLLRFSTGGEG